MSWEKYPKTKIILNAFIWFHEKTSADPSKRGPTYEHEK